MREPIYLRNIMMTFISNNALRRSKNYLNADMRKLGLKPFSTYYDFSAKIKNAFLKDFPVFCICFVKV